MRFYYSCYKYNDCQTKTFLWANTVILILAYLQSSKHLKKFNFVKNTAHTSCVLTLN